MWPLLKDLWTDRVVARTVLLAAISFAVTYFTIDPSLGQGARIAFALGQTFLVGTASFSPSRGVVSGVVKGSATGLFCIVLATGCLSWGKDLSPTERYYAAVGDYLLLEEQATSYCELPSTPFVHCERIEEIILEAQDARKAAESARQAGQGADGFERAANVTIALAEQLRAILAARAQR